MVETDHPILGDAPPLPTAETIVRGPLHPLRTPPTPGPDDAARRRLWWRELPLLAVVPVLLCVMAITGTWRAINRSVHNG